MNWRISAANAWKAKFPRRTAAVESKAQLIQHMQMRRPLWNVVRKSYVDGEVNDMDGMDKSSSNNNCEVRETFVERLNG